MEDLEKKVEEFNRAFIKGATALAARLESGTRKRVIHATFHDNGYSDYFDKVYLVGDFTGVLSITNSSDQFDISCGDCEFFRYLTERAEVNKRVVLDPNDKFSYDDLVQSLSWGWGKYGDVIDVLLECRGDEPSLLSR